MHHACVDQTESKKKAQNTSSKKQPVKEDNESKSQSDPKGDSRVEKQKRDRARKTKIYEALENGTFDPKKFKSIQNKRILPVMDSWIILRYDLFEVRLRLGKGE